MTNEYISRQSAIEAIFKVGHEHIMENVLPLGAVLDYSEAIKALPSAQQWIPCSERLPEARRSVILSTKEWTGEGCYWETTTNHVIWKGYRWNATYWDDEVIAWMPLPEPYKEVTE